MKINECNIEVSIIYGTASETTASSPSDLFQQENIKLKPRAVQCRYQNTFYTIVTERNIIVRKSLYKQILRMKTFCEPKHITEPRTLTL